MNKELETFNRIALHTEFDNDGAYDYLNFEDDCKTVENALEVLDIVKEIITMTEDKIQDILRCKDYEEYVTLWYWEKELPEEDFNLLKEYFKHE